MPTFEELKEQYMFVEAGADSGSSSSGGSTGPTIPIHSGNHVDPLIDGSAYFARLKSLITPLGDGDGEFIYLSGWWFGPDFTLDGLGGGRLVTDLLKAKARAGVDVRVLGWVMAPEVMQHIGMIMSAPGALGMLNVNNGTMRFVNDLRTEPALAHKAVLNILAHPAGAVHVKMAIVGDRNQATGFTGGIDLENSRHAAIWHDVQAEVRGPAVQSMFAAYRDMWNEVEGRSPVVGLHIPAFTFTTSNGTTVSVPDVRADSHTHAMPQLPSRRVRSTSSEHKHVQSARTLPNFDFASLGGIASIGASMSGMSLPTNQPLSYAPSGLFEIKSIWRKGIQGARSFIYAEDQGFTSTEIFDWMNSALKSNPDLNVVLLTGRYDPNDEPNALMNKMRRIAVNDHLLDGLSPSDIDRVGFFTHTQRVIHAKTTIVDDQWALVGSANLMRRSLYTDFEHSIGYMDEGGTAVKDYRESLWGGHLQASIPDPQAALAAWFAVPFQGGSSPGPSGIERIHLPMPAATLTSQERVMIDEISDPDSRRAWGGALVRQYMDQYGGDILSD